MKAHRVCQMAATAGLLAMTMGATGVSAIAATTGDTISIHANADIEARGAGLTVTVSYMCAPGEVGNFISVAVTERVGRTIAGGGGGVNTVVCDGKTHGAKVALNAQPGGRPFTAGTAFATASLQTFNPSNGSQSGSQAYRTIILTN